jgi:hypothetical protein
MVVSAACSKQSFPVAAHDRGDAVGTQAVCLKHVRCGEWRARDTFSKIVMTRNNMRIILPK